MWCCQSCSCRVVVLAIASIRMTLGDEVVIPDSPVHFRFAFVVVLGIDCNKNPKRFLHRRVLVGFRASRIPRPLKGSKKWNPLIIPWLPQCSNGFIFLGGFHFFGSSKGSG